MKQKMPINNPIPEDGSRLPLVEDFYTLQGEGFHTGKAAYFIRIGGCDVGCSWCDTKFSWNVAFHPLVSVDEIVSRVLNEPAKAVVVTGGEPMTYNLDLLCRRFAENKIEAFLETSGTYDFSGKWDWICLSPKRHEPPKRIFLEKANELKVIIESASDFDWANNIAQQANTNAILFLQPEWSKHEEILPQIIDYIKMHPEWRISLQAHKYMRIP